MTILQRLLTLGVAMLAPLLVQAQPSPANSQDPVLVNSVDELLHPDNARKWLAEGNKINLAVNGSNVIIGLSTDSVTINSGDHLTGGGTVTLGNAITLNVSDDWLDTSGDTLTGVLDMGGNDLVDGATVIWDASVGQIPDPAVSNALTVSSSGSVNDGALSSLVSLLGQNIEDAEVDNDLTISASGSVEDGALSSLVSLLGQNIEDSEVDDAITISASGSVADGALSNLVSLLGQNIEDSEVDDAITISSSGSVADGALSAFVSLLGQTISESEMNLANSPFSGGKLSWNGSQLEWQTDNDTDTDTHVAVQNGGVNVGSPIDIINFSSGLSVTYDSSNNRATVDATSSGDGGITQEISFGANLSSGSSSGSDFLSANGTSQATTQGNATTQTAYPITTSGSIKTVAIITSNDLSGTSSTEFTIFKNDSATSTVLTVNGGADSVETFGVSESVAAGDKVHLKWTNLDTTYPGPTMATMVIE